MRPLQLGAARRPPPPKSAKQQPRNCCPKVVAPSFSKLQSHGQAWDTCVMHLAHASVSWPACEKYRPTLPRSASIVNSYAVAQSCNVSLISSLSGTDREEILGNIQIWLEKGRPHHVTKPKTSPGKILEQKTASSSIVVPHSRNCAPDRSISLFKILKGKLPGSRIAEFLHFRRST